MAILRVDELAAAHGVSTEFVLAAMDDLGVSGRFFTGAIISPHTRAMFEADWLPRLQSLSPDQRAALTGQDARIGVPIDVLRNELDLDWHEERRYRDELGIKLRWGNRGIAGLRPEEAKAFRDHVAAQRSVPATPLGGGAESATTPVPAVEFSRRVPQQRTPRVPRARRRSTVEDLGHLPLEDAAKVLAEGVKTGRRHRGHIDAVTGYFLDLAGVTKRPPFEDEHARAWQEAKAWYSAGFLDANEILRWLEEAPGLTPGQAYACRDSAVDPRALATRWNGRGLAKDGPYTLRQSLVGGWDRGRRVPTITVDNAVWLLDQANKLPNAST